MKTAIVAVIVIAILAVGGWLAFGMNNKNSSPPAASNNTSDMSNMSNMANMAQSSSGSSQSQAAQSANKVTIQNFAFAPGNITVKKGTTVTWTNNDSVAHTVTGDNGGPSSQDVSPGGSYSYTFNQTGTFNYHCSIHPYMTGTVTVTSA